MLLTDIRKKFHLEFLFGLSEKNADSYVSLKIFDKIYNLCLKQNIS